MYSPASVVMPASVAGAVLAATTDGKLESLPVTGAATFMLCNVAIFLIFVGLFLLRKQKLASTK